MGIWHVFEALRALIIIIIIREFRITLPQSSQSQRTADVTGTLDYQAKTR